MSVPSRLPFERIPVTLRPFALLPFARMMFVALLLLSAPALSVPAQAQGQDRAQDQPQDRAQDQPQAKVQPGQIPVQRQTAVTGESAAQLVWLDTDIGDDIDDAYALALVLHSPELHLIGISTAFGNTQLRARLLDRFLNEGGYGAQQIPVFAGVETITDNLMSQAAYARGAPERTHSSGVAALLEAAHAHPGQITLIAIGPLFNIGAAIDQDPAGFRLLRRVVMMGGSIRRGYDDPRTHAHRPADAEWNINRDPDGARKLLASGVPIFLLPLDSTQVRLHADRRQQIFSSGQPLNSQLARLEYQWNEATGSPTPTVFDAVAVAYALRPQLCPMVPMRLSVDDKGFTREIPGAPNVQVCLASHSRAFVDFLVRRLVGQAK